MLNIVKKQIRNNYTDGRYAKKYIIIHETDNTRAGADAMAHFSYWDKNPRARASTTFVVDDKEQVQMMDLLDKPWAIGVIYGNPRNVTDADNNNSINIEICVNSDGDYMKARQNCIDLVKYLMQVTGIPASNVIRHYDACKKWCPRTMMNHPELWDDFKAQIAGVAPKPVPKPVPLHPQVADQSIKELQEVLNKLGFKGKDGKVLKVDGLKGDNTDFAIEAFQKVMGITVDGDPGSITMSAIAQILAKPKCGDQLPDRVYAVRYVQWRVGAKVDGDFGDLTEKAVKAWQKNHGLGVDGVVGIYTWAKLIG